MVDYSEQWSLGMTKTIRYDLMHMIGPIYNRDGTVVGELTGCQRPCQMEGCHGMRLHVKWPDDTWTWPCSRGIKQRRDKAFQIL